MYRTAVRFSIFSFLVALTACYQKDSYNSIELPIKSRHDLDIIKTQSEESDHVTYVDVNGGRLPVYITFKTQSSPIYVKQEHKGTKGSHQKSDSKDEPHLLSHEVLKPVYQEIKEIIQPYRKIVQVIEPVVEERFTKVYKGERSDKYGSGENNGYGNDDGQKYSGNGGKGYGVMQDLYKAYGNINDYKRYKD